MGMSHQTVFSTSRARSYKGVGTKVCVLVFLIFLFGIISWKSTLDLHSSKMSFWKNLPNRMLSNDERDLNVEKVCRSMRKRNISINALVRHILVDDARRILWCVVPKVACTNWKRALAISSGILTPEDIDNMTFTHGVPTSRNPSKIVHSNYFLKRANLKHLKDYSHGEIISRLRSYFSFMFVRDPFTRLVSAWKDKFSNLNHDYVEGFAKHHGRYIIRQYRKGASEEEINSGKGVHFDEFIKYIVDKRGDKMNTHWESYEKLCHPCQVHYDFIGKFENIARDAQFVLGEIGGAAAALGEFPARENGPSSESPTHDIAPYYANITYTVMSSLRKTYNLDFKLFEYNPFGH